MFLPSLRTTGVSLFLCGRSSDEWNSFVLTRERFFCSFILLRVAIPLGCSALNYRLKSEIYRSNKRFSNCMKGCVNIILLFSCFQSIIAIVATEKSQHFNKTFKGNATSRFQHIKLQYNMRYLCCLKYQYFFLKFGVPLNSLIKVVIWSQHGLLKVN